MSRMFVRTTWSSNLTADARDALEAMADGAEAAVSGAPTGPTNEGVNVNRKTALMFLRFDYAEQTPDDRLAITRGGSSRSAGSN